MRTMRFSWRRKNWVRYWRSPSNSWSKPFTLVFSISIMKYSAPSLFWAEMTKSLYITKRRRWPPIMELQNAKNFLWNLLLDRGQDLNTVNVLTHGDFSEVHSLFLDDLALTVLVSAIWSEALLVVAVTCVPTFLKEGLRTVCCPIFLNDEIGRSTHVCVVWLLAAIQGHLLFLGKQCIGVFADVVQNFASLVIFLHPPGNVVIGFLFLKAL